MKTIGIIAGIVGAVILALFFSSNQEQPIGALKVAKLDVLAARTVSNEGSPYVEYYYASNTKVNKKKKDLENVSKRTLNSITEDLGSGVFRTTFSNKPQHFKVGNDWYEPVIATATVEEFNQAMAIKPKKDILGFIGVARADTGTYYPLTGDAQIQNSGGADWATVRDATTGTLSTTVGRLRSVNDGGIYGLGRLFYTMDTSTLPTGATITAATFSVYGYEKTTVAGQTRSYRLYNSTHADTIVADDFNNAGTTEYSDTYFAQTDWSTTGYNGFTLNAAGLAAIVKAGYTKFAIREQSKDVANVAPTDSAQNYYASAYLSAQAAGTTQDPKLEVTYTVSAVSPSIDISDEE